MVRQLRKKGIVVVVYVFARKHEPFFSGSGSTQYYSISAGDCWPVINLHAIIKLWNKLSEYDLVHAYYGMAALGFLKKKIQTSKTVAILAGIDSACARNIVIIKIVGCIRFESIVSF